MLREEMLHSIDDLETSPDELLIRQEQEAEFMNLLNRLPLPQRSALLLFYVEAFSLEEIAGITGTTLGTVKSRLHYARKTLKSLIEKIP
jgi:RNA polymerase sigma-70 factor, ECF subfamily